MAHSPRRISLYRNRIAIAGMFILGGLLASAAWYWGWGRSRSLDELDPSQIPAEYRFEGQPPELVAVLTTKSAFIGTVGIAFSPEGKRVAAGFGNGEIVVWDVGRLKEIAVWRAHSLPVGSLVFSADGQTLISGSYDKTIRLWDLAAWEPKKKAVLRGHTDQVWSLALSPDGNLLASGSTDKTLRLWDLRSRPPRQRNLLELSGFVWSVSFGWGGRALACSDDQAIRVWDINADNPREMVVSRNHPKSVWRVAFAPDGKMLASCGEDKTVRLWESDGDRLRYRAELHGHTSIALYGLVFSPDGQTLVSMDGDGRVIVWDVNKRSERYRCQLPKGLRNVVFAPDGRHLAISTASKNIVYILRVPA